MVVLFGPQLFIICCSIKQAWWHLLHWKMQTAHDSTCNLPLVPLFTHSISIFIVALCPRYVFFLYTTCVYLHSPSPMCTTFVSSLCLCASLMLSHTTFIPSCPLHLFLWIQYPQIMREWFSWVWPVAQIRVRQYFCLTAYVGNVWLECFRGYWRRIVGAFWSVHHQVKE